MNQDQTITKTGDKQIVGSDTDHLVQMKQQQGQQVQMDVGQAGGQVHQMGYVSDQSQQVQQQVVSQQDSTNQRVGAVGSTAARVMDGQAGDVQVAMVQGLPLSSGQPERGPVSQQSAESAPIVEIREHEIPPEVSEYIQKVEKENLELEKPVVHQGTPVVQPPVSVEEPEVILPMTKSSFVTGMEAKVNTSVRWLAEWCLRVIKKFSGKTAYAPEEPVAGER